MASVAGVDSSWIDTWLMCRLQELARDLSADSPARSRRAVQFLDRIEPSEKLLHDLTGAEQVSLRPDDRSTDGDRDLRPWRLRHALLGLHHGVLTMPGYRAVQLVHAARVHGLRVVLLPVGIGDPAIPDAVDLGALGIAKPVLIELWKRGITTVGGVRAMSRADLLELDFPSTATASLQSLRGQTSQRARPATGVSVEGELTLDPFQRLDANTAATLREAAEAEVRRRAQVRLPEAAALQCPAATRQWLQREIERRETLHVQLDLAARAGEINELLQPFHADDKGS